QPHPEGPGAGATAPGPADSFVGRRAGPARPRLSRAAPAVRPVLPRDENAGAGAVRGLPDRSTATVAPANRGKSLMDHGGEHRAKSAGCRSLVRRRGPAPEPVALRTAGNDAAVWRASLQCASGPRPAPGKG